MNPAPMPLISALYTGVFALLLVALAMLVSRRRRSMGIAELQLGRDLVPEPRDLPLQQRYLGAGASRSVLLAG